MRLRTALLLAALLLPVHAEPARSQAGSGGTVAFVGVNVVPMDAPGQLTGQTVVVEGERISAIGPAESVSIPPDARIIFGRGRWLMPGLIDMHVHIRARDLEAYLPSGVTTVRDMAGLESVSAAAGRVERGEVRGPRIVFATPLLDGPEARNPPFSVIVDDPEQAGAILDSQLARGCRFAKVYDSLPEATYDAIVAAARERNVKVVGHVSRFIDVRHAIEQGQDSIEHLSGYERALSSRPSGGDVLDWAYMREAPIAELVSATVSHGVANCPTLHVFHVLSGQWGIPASQIRPVLENRARFVRALRDGGATILLGTDAGYLLPAGTALHDEIDEFLAAGLTPWETLSAGTSVAARFLGMGDEIGTVEMGKIADLLLLSANPLESPATLRHPVGVMTRGRWIPLARRRAVSRQN